MENLSPKRDEQIKKEQVQSLNEHIEKGLQDLDSGNSISSDQAKRHFEEKIARQCK